MRAVLARAPAVESTEAYDTVGDLLTAIGGAEVKPPYTSAKYQRAVKFLGGRRLRPDPGGVPRPRAARRLPAADGLAPVRRGRRLEAHQDRDAGVEGPQPHVARDVRDRPPQGDRRRSTRSIARSSSTGSGWRRGDVSDAQGHEGVPVLVPGGAGPADGLRRRLDVGVERRARASSGRCCNDPKAKLDEAATFTKFLKRPEGAQQAGDADLRPAAARLGGARGADRRQGLQVRLRQGRRAALRRQDRRGRREQDPDLPAEDARRRASSSRPSTRWSTCSRAGRSRCGGWSRRSTSTRAATRLTPIGRRSPATRIRTSALT